MVLPSLRTRIYEYTHNMNYWKRRKLQWIYPINYKKYEYYFVILLKVYLHAEVYENFSKNQRYSNGNGAKFFPRNDVHTKLSLKILVENCGKGKLYLRNINTGSNPSVVW